MEWIKAKTILTKVKNGADWYGIDYNMNLYKGCSHGCIYCDSRSNCYHIDRFDIVRGKENALLILERELIKNKKVGVIGIGAMSDPYNKEEIKEYQTRKALKLIAKYGYGVSIDTKSTLILRDIELLKEITSKNNVIVKFTITTPKDELSKVIEPNVAVTSKRLEAIKQLTDHGIFTGIMLNPVLPFLTDKEEEIKELVKLAANHGARFIHTYMGMTLRENQRDYYFDKLDKIDTSLKSKYIKYYGTRYFVSPLNAKKLYQTFTKECDKYGILYNMQDIITAYKKEIKTNEQTSLF